LKKGGGGSLLDSVTRSINPLQHSNSLLEELKGKLHKPHEVATFENLLALFLSVQVRCILGNLVEKSKSTASRWFNKAIFDEQAWWRSIQQWQLARLKEYEQHKVGRKGWMLLRIDLTSIEKTGKKLPFLRVYNGVQGIHLVVLHVSIGYLSFPLAYRIYDPSKSATPIELALELLSEFPAWCFAGWTCWLLVDSGFYSEDFIHKARRLGYTNLSLGARENLRLADARHLRDCRQGERIELQTMPGKALFVTYVDLPRNNTIKRFFVLCTQKGCARTLRRRYSKRWLIEAFFKSIKYDFGLKEARLRTEIGIQRWILLSFLAFSLASVTRAFRGIKPQPKAAKPSYRFVLSLAQAAKQVIDHLLLDYSNRILLLSIHQQAQTLGLKVFIVPDPTIHRLYACNS